LDQMKHLAEHYPGVLYLWGHCQKGRQYSLRDETRDDWDQLSHYLVVLESVLSQGEGAALVVFLLAFFFLNRIDK